MAYAFRDELERFKHGYTSSVTVYNKPSEIGLTMVQIEIREVKGRSLI